MQYITTFFHKWEKVVEKIYELEFLSPNRKGDQSLGYQNAEVLKSPIDSFLMRRDSFQNCGKSYLVSEA